MPSALGVSDPKASAYSTVQDAPQPMVSGFSNELFAICCVVV